MAVRITARNRAHEAGRAQDRDHPLSLECLICIQASCLRFGKQMWRDKANRLHRWPSVHESHDLVAVQSMFRCPTLPVPLALVTTHSRAALGEADATAARAALQILPSNMRPGGRMTVRITET
jgi:hypothetical protein